jgi:hypothetical protein
MFANILLFAIAIGVAPETRRDRPSLTFVVVGTSILSLANLALTLLITRRHSNLSRLLLLGLFLLGLHFEGISLSVRWTESATNELMRLTCRALEATALVLAFLPSSNEWFPLPKPWTDFQRYALSVWTWIILASLLGRGVPETMLWLQNALRPWLGPSTAIAGAVGLLVIVLGVPAAATPVVLRVLQLAYERLVRPISRKPEPSRTT